MLAYLGHGWRDYGNNPLDVGTRPYWEFQAVLKGRIGPRLLNTAQPLYENCLWIFPPHHPHGWNGDPQEKAEVAVFHYPVVPSVLSDLIPDTGFMTVTIEKSIQDRMRELSQDAARHFHQPDALSHLRHEHLLLELCIMVAGNHISKTTSPHQKQGSPVVANAIRWYASHLETDPGLEAIGKAVGASPAHLRRLFHSTHGCSPSEVFRRIQIQRAVDMMHDSNDTLESIAERCGYSSVSAFSRSFKQRMGYAPSQWRRGIAGYYNNSPK